MGYFSNGTEGAMYQERWCERCRNDDGCPIWMAHLLYNYDDNHTVLDQLIPRIDGENAMCCMFEAADVKVASTVRMPGSFWREHVMTRCPSCRAAMDDASAYVSSWTGGDVSGFMEWLWEKKVGWVWANGGCMSPNVFRVELLDEFITMKGH